MAGPGLQDATRVTDANPQQAEYRWGRRILFEYTNRDGVRLQGTLAIPDGYQEGQRLPMLVNFYEKNSQNLHRHPTPRYASSPQFAGYVSDGYLVMQPDVHFRGRTSHSDMLECVEAAVQKVIEMGYADPARVGLHGHSYSGGGASFIATRSKMFAAVVAGAAPINLVAEFNILFRGSGQNNHRYDIHGQGRYGTNPYDDFDLYWAQSPISGVRDMNTPLLYMHGAEDPTVEYNQGMEFYNALRFNGKPVIFLSYPGEGHSLSKLENQLDYLVRMEQFYGHHLRGEQAPAWIQQGEAFIAKDRREPIPVNVRIVAATNRDLRGRPTWRRRSTSHPQPSPLPCPEGAWRSSHPRMVTASRLPPRRTRRASAAACSSRSRRFGGSPVPSRGSPAPPRSAPSRVRGAASAA